MNSRKSVSVEFTEQRSAAGGVLLWAGVVTGEPLQVFDRVKGAAVPASHSFRCDIFPECDGEWFCLMTQWYTRHGHRYAFYKSLGEAMEAGRNWASRRFAYLQGGES